MYSSDDTHAQKPMCMSKHVNISMVLCVYLARFVIQKCPSSLIRNIEQQKPNSFKKLNQTSP